jgi:hypothetical protein
MASLETYRPEQRAPKRESEAKDAATRPQGTLSAEGRNNYQAHLGTLGVSGGNTFSEQLDDIREQFARLGRWVWRTIGHRFHLPTHSRHD